MNKYVVIYGSFLKEAQRFIGPFDSYQEADKVSSEMMNALHASFKDHPQRDEVESYIDSSYLDSFEIVALFKPDNPVEAYIEDVMNDVMESADLEPEEDEEEEDEP